MTKWKERSFYHVVPPHRYSYQSFGRQMVAAQQVANILDRARILGLIWALSTWNEVVFIKNSGAGNTLIVSPNRFVTGSNWGQPSAKADVSGGLGGAGSPVPPGGRQPETGKRGPASHSSIVCCIPLCEYFVSPNVYFVRIFARRRVGVPGLSHTVPSGSAACGVVVVGLQCVFCAYF